MLVRNESILKKKLSTKCIQKNKSTNEIYQNEIKSAGKRSNYNQNDHLFDGQSTGEDNKILKNDKEMKYLDGYNSYGNIIS